PWPGKSRATFRFSNGPCANTAPGKSWTGTEGSGCAIRSATPSPRFSSASADASSLSARTSNESATSASRASPCVRCESVYATSANERPSRLRPGREAAICRANFATTGARAPPSRNSSARALPGAGSVRRGWAGCGASSSTRCTLVPPNPNELTPARRGRPFLSHGVSALGRKNGPAPSSSFAFSSATPGCGGNFPWWSARAVLIRPAMPDADMVCPMFALTLPSTVRMPPPFAHHESVGAGVEGTAFTTAGQRPDAAEAHQVVRQQVQVHPTRDREVDLAAAQVDDGLLRGDQRRGAGRVDRERGAAQVPCLGDDGGGNVEQVAGHREGPHRHHVLDQR